MSIPRYSINPLWWNIPLMDDHNGKLCEYRDYARLQDTLQCSLNSNRELKVENARLKAEVDSLYRHGDLMLKFAAANMTFPAYATMAKDWNAAKEGKQSK
jgi:hypothetical protein